MEGNTIGSVRKSIIIKEVSMDKIKSTGILINKVKLMDKIDCEIESAEKSIDEFVREPEERSKYTEGYLDGKIKALQDLKQWIEDLE